MEVQITQERMMIKNKTRKHKKATDALRLNN